MGNSSRVRSIWIYKSFVIYSIHFHNRIIKFQTFHIFYCLLYIKSHVLFVMRALLNAKGIFLLWIPNKSFKHNAQCNENRKGKSLPLKHASWHTPSGHSYTKRKRTKVNIMWWNGNFFCNDVSKNKWKNK